MSKLQLIIKYFIGLICLFCITASFGFSPQKTPQQNEPLVCIKAMEKALADQHEQERNQPVYAIVGAKLFTGKEIINNHALLIKGSIIENVLPEKDIPPQIKRINFTNHLIAPGYIDLHINGCGGVNFNDHPSEKILKHIHTSCLRKGTTTFIPTLISSSDQIIFQGISAVKDFKKSNKFTIPGLHLEGPWLTTTAKKGIHNEADIRPYSAQLHKKITEENAVIAKITVAPEQVPDGLIRDLTTAGILVSVGHSSATAEKTKQAFKEGARFVTHLFNGMSGITARNPGVITPVLSNTDGNLYASIIADGFHLSWDNFMLAKKNLPESLVLITDGTAASASSISSFWFAGQTIYVDNNKCTSDKGVLSGSALTMEQAVKNVIRHTTLPAPEVLKMATLYPARAIGAANMIGSLATGHLANAVILDSEYNVNATMEMGRVQLYHSPQRQKLTQTKSTLPAPDFMVVPDKQAMGDYVADYIVAKINAFTPTKEKPFLVLGLSTGSTPLPVYNKLIELYKKGKVSFKNVVTFNMDEYAGLPASHPQSYHYFMHKNLFNHIDIPRDNVFILDGMADDQEKECAQFEIKIRKMGGIDLFLGGIGSNGHIAFNEPGSDFNSVTRVVNLTSNTIKDNARFFKGDTTQVPTKALSIGIGTYLNSKEVIIMASGKNKAEAIQKAFQQPATEQLPASALQKHSKAFFICDIDSAENSISSL